MSSDLLLKVSQAEGDPGDEVLMEVGRAVGGLLAHCRAALATRQLDVAAAVWGTSRLMREQRRTTMGAAGIEVIAGRHAMARALARAYSEPLSNRLSLYAEQVPPCTDARAATDARLAAQGVRMRAVYQHERGEAVPQGSGGVEIRFADVVPVNVVVVDDRTAVLPVDPDQPGVGLVVVNDPGWVRLVSVLAESCWVRATIHNP